jgi:hypothetical protein
MQLQSDLATPACPYCGDRLLAPEVSEFVARFSISGRAIPAAANPTPRSS